MAQTKPIPYDDIVLMRPFVGWSMNQEVDDELQVHPNFPLVFGVDGRFPGTMRRFRGFKRLDYDIRYPHSNVGYAHLPIVHTGLEGIGPLVGKSSSSLKKFGPASWSGVADNRIDPDNSTIYQFVGGTLDRAYRSEGAADRRPVSVFLIHMLDENGEPMVKMLGRTIGDDSVSALFQAVLIGNVIDPSPSVPALLNLRLADTYGSKESGIDWVGLTLAGRFILLSHRGGHPEISSKAGDTFIYDVPYIAWVGEQAGQLGARHALANPGVDYPTLDNGFVQKGDKFARCKLAGTRGFSWLHPTPVEETEIIGMGAVLLNFQATPVGNPDEVAVVALPDDEDTTYLSVELGSVFFEPSVIEYSLAANGIPGGDSLIEVSIKVRFRAFDESPTPILVTPFFFDVNPRVEGITVSHTASGPGYTTFTEAHARPGGGAWVLADLSRLGIQLLHGGPYEAGVSNLLVTSVSVEVRHIATQSPDGAVRFDGFADGTKVANIAPHVPGNLFKLRVRLVNFTTGFVGPMSEPIQLQVGPVGESSKISWVPGTRFVAKDLDAGAVKIDAVTKPILRNLLMSVFGADIDDGLGHGRATRTAYTSPETQSRDGLYTTVIQVWVTQSVPDDNPSGGGGYYYLDQEIPVVYRFPLVIDPLFLFVEPYLWPGWLGEPYLGEKLLGGTIPNKSNDALAVSEVYRPDSDDVGALEPSKALGTVGSALLSFSDGGSTLSDDLEPSEGDIRVSPPWKFFPGNWVEAVAPLFRHRVSPKGLTPPRFVNVGDIGFLVDQNKMVRIIRDGATVYMNDVDISGGINRDGVTGAGQTIVVVTSTGIDEINPVTLEMRTISIVQRIISERWQAFARTNRIMSGYDPQLKAVFIAPRRALTSTEWLRSEALVVWVSTGRITMLSDVYWTGMTRGVHPVTGKEHLFFIDPAHNITYPDDSLDDDSPATMVGINTPVDPSFPTTGWVRQPAIWTLTVVGVTFDSLVAIVVDGFVLQEGVSGSWDKSSGTPEGIATSIANTITSIMSAPDFNVASAVAVGSVVTITSNLVGVINEDFDFVSVLGIPINIVVAKVQGGEAAAGPPFVAGGAYQGVVTGVSPVGGTTVVTDSSLDPDKSGVNFDLYASYNPQGSNQIYSALVGAQVYFFREIVDDVGFLRPTLVADGRVGENTAQTLTFNNSELNYHNGAVGIQIADHYTVSPVVLQAVGASIATEEGLGSGIVTSGSVDSLSVMIRNRKGAAVSGGQRIPAGSPMQGALFLGIASKFDLESRELGQVVVPRRQVGVSKRLDGKLIWDEENMELVTAPVNTHGNSLFPVVTCWGANYLFDLVLLSGRVSRTGVVSGSRPEGY